MVSSFSVQDDDDLPLDVINRTSEDIENINCPLYIAAIADRHGTRKISNQHILQCEEEMRDEHAPDPYYVEAYWATHATLDERDSECA